jgi:glycosyltransferase involved in cell wall biosynthesis
MSPQDLEIDVVMLTKNSNKPWFKRVLKAIKEEVPVHHFIVVDGYSTDGTIEVVKEFFDDKLILLRTRKPLGCARYLGMKLVDTEWFAFIDSDVEILPGWFKSALKYMKDERIWGVQGSFGRAKDVLLTRSPRKDFSWNVILKYGIVNFYGADTSHVLMRREVVNLVNPKFLCYLECGEDAYIAWKIVEAGYLYIKISKLQAAHYSSPQTSLRKALHRSFSHNGLFYAIPYSAYAISSAIRFLTSLYKCRIHESLIYLINTLGGVFSYSKTKYLLSRVKENE